MEGRGPSITLSTVLSSCHFPWRTEENHG